MSNLLGDYFHKGIQKKEDATTEIRQEPQPDVAPALVKKPRKFDGIANEVADLDPTHFRIYVGNLGDEVTDGMLVECFQEFESFQKAKLVKDYKTGKSKGFAFVTFKDGKDFLKALRQKNNTFIGRRPMKIKKSKWKLKE